MSPVAIIQARMSSTRLPGKVLADIEGATMLAHVIARAQRSSTLGGVVLATSSAREDDPIEEECGRLGVACFRGSLDDVLDRYYQAAGSLRAEVVVRLTADCPLLDPAVIDQVVDAFDGARFDYVSNTIDRSFPDGLDTEVFTMEALARAWREARLASEREHVTPYLWKHKDLFRQSQVVQNRDLSALRWTVDEPRDLELVRRVYQQFGHSLFGMNDIMALLARDPALSELNAGIDCNEGYDRSVREDRVLDLPEER